MSDFDWTEFDRGPKHPLEMEGVTPMCDVRQWTPGERDRGEWICVLHANHSDEVPARHLWQWYGRHPAPTDVDAVRDIVSKVMAP